MHIIGNLRRIEFSVFSGAVMERFIDIVLPKTRAIIRVSQLSSSNATCNISSALSPATRVSVSILRNTIWSSLNRYYSNSQSLWRGPYGSPSLFQHPTMTETYAVSGADVSFSSYDILAELNNWDNTTSLDQISTTEWRTEVQSEKSNLL